MLWRKFKLDWPYLVGEILIVTLGVLIALALDSWNDTRLAHHVEDEILGRLISDMEADTALYTAWSKNLEEKLVSLDRVSEVLSKPESEIDDSLAFLSAIAAGSYYGWNQPPLSRTTFDELVSSGSLGLIDDPRMRRLIVEYYHLDEDSRGRMEPRRTEYPRVAYRLVPHAAEFTVQEDLEGPGLRLTLNTIRQSELSEHVLAETNFGRFILGMIVPLDSLARNLLAELASYRDAG